MRKRRSKAEWIRICEEFEGSGDTAVAFARKRRINLSTLHGWRSRLRKEGLLGGRSSGFVELLSTPAITAPRVIVRFGKVAVEFVDAVPPVSWLQELAAEC